MTVSVLCLFLAGPWAGLWYEIVVLPDHTHFFIHNIDYKSMNCVLYQKKGILDMAIKLLFSCSTQMSKKFHLLRKTKMQKNKEFSCFQALRCFIYHVNKLTFTFMSMVNFMLH